MPKFIFISGGVISGIGKGVSAASVGFILKSYGYKITMIKADPYLNVDAGTMNPLEHGETFVLEDGFETDMDSGTYERYTGEHFTRENSMTLGAVLERVIKNERSLAYDGKWVSMDFHVPHTIIDWLMDVAKNKDADIVIVEIGGTVGEVGNQIFLEANRVMKVKNPNDVIHIHVSYLPVPDSLGEMKSKPVQISTKLLNMSGINPDMIIARSEQEMDEVRIEKLSQYCTVEKEAVIPAPNVSNIYQIPLNFEIRNMGQIICDKLGLVKKDSAMLTQWTEKIKNIMLLHDVGKKIKIGIVGKYYKSGKYYLKDSYVSVLEALNHAAWEQNVEPEIHWIVADELETNPEKLEELTTFDGIIVPQGWGTRGAEGKIRSITSARINKIPYLGLCYGMQMATIEFSRNVLGLKDANSEEVNKESKEQVIHLMDSQRENIAKKSFGGTIRLGAYPCVVKPGTILDKMYTQYGNGLYTKPKTGEFVIQERHRHRFEFNNKYRDQLEKAGLVISGVSPDNSLVEAIELPISEHPYFVATQYHPELKTQFLHPHPLFRGFIEACITRRELQK
jgi:CTP synthase